MADLIDRAEVLNIVQEYDGLYEAIAALPAQGVRVKPLEWHFEQEDVQVAPTSARHEYRIVFDRRATVGAWMWFCDGAWIGCETEEAAKAAAQADYERRILAALPAQVEKMRGTGWQPIETAPRDGTEILTIRDNGVIAKAQWYDNPFGRTDTVIERQSGKWWSVTHWMPLPLPPAALAPAEAGGVEACPCGSDVTDMDGHIVHDDECPESWQAQVTIRKSQTVAPAPVDALVGAAGDLKEIVEGIKGAMEHGAWRDEKGKRLKDTPEWVALYNALAAYRGGAK